MELYENDSLIGYPQYAGNGNYRLNHYPSVGKVYRLRVEAPGFPPVEAIDSLPGRVEEASGRWLTHTPVPLIDELGLPYTSFLMDISLKDIPGEQNFYHISLAMLDSCVCVFSDPDTVLVDPLHDRLWLIEAAIDEPLSDPNSKKANAILIEDTGFQNALKHLNFYLDTTYLYAYSFPLSYSDSINQDFLSTGAFSDEAPRKYVRIFADIRSISQSLYLYERSYLRQGFGTEDPFYEFENVYSNVKGGLGIFAGWQRQLIEVYSD